MGGLKDSLRDAIRQIAFRTSVDRLRKQGVKQVSVLGLDRIIALIDAAERDSQIAAAQAVKAAGLAPVPHVPARFIVDEADLKSRIKAL
ncbi:MAG: hypothetical protein ACK595_00305, partial [Planctomycetota bacterium]